MAITTKEFLRRKRDKEPLSEQDISHFIAGAADGSVGDEQLAAFAMAVFLNGLADKETVALTKSMKNSGAVLSWDDLDGPVVDKHSTGGVGDKVSLMLAPMAAACGCFVPMISGRGLGHTGGTLDKMDAIPGYNTTPGIAAFKKTVAEVGCCIIGQTAEMAPADKRLYAVRDSTSTVECIPLITSSILSKKLCAGISALTMDVKTGSGAFLKDIDMARNLGRTILRVAQLDGVRAGGLITDMNQVLGWTAGNALEVAESIEFLTTSRREPRLLAVTLALTANMLEITGLATPKEAEQKAMQALESGAAAEKFGAMVAACGGPSDIVENYKKYLPKAACVEAVPSKASGYLTAMDVRRIGELVTALGGGRNQLKDKLDYSVGFSETLPLGAKVAAGAPLTIIHAKSRDDAQRIAEAYQKAVIISDDYKEPPKPILESL